MGNYRSYSIHVMVNMRECRVQRRSSGFAPHILEDIRYIRFRFIVFAWDETH